MRHVYACLAASLMATLTACQDRAVPAAAAPANDSAPVVAAPIELDQRERMSGETSEFGRPEMMPRMVMDTTPVDTEILGVTTSNNGNDKMLTGQMTDQFKPTEGVFLDIRTKGTAPKYTLSAKWLTPGSEILTEYSQIISTSGEANTIFSLSKPDNWAKGTYKVELFINGKFLRSVPFTVR